MGPELLESAEVEKKKAPTIPVKLHDDVVASARIISALDGVTMTDLLSDILRPILGKMEREGLARRSAAIQAEGKPRKKGEA